MSARHILGLKKDRKAGYYGSVQAGGNTQGGANNLLNINFTYLDGIRSYRDINAYGWHYRNKQLKRMMTARQ